MITLMVIGILVFAFKMVGWAFKAAWGLAKVALYIVVFPLILVGLVFAGIFYAAVPLLIIGLLAAFLVPKVKPL